MQAPGVVDGSAEEVTVAFAEREMALIAVDRSLFPEFVEVEKGALPAASVVYELKDVGDQMNCVRRDIGPEGENAAIPVENCKSEGPFI